MIAVSLRRASVLAEAETWLGTPYHHMGRLKGVGCDCLTLLAEVYRNAGIVGPIEIPYYPPDWHLHRSAERYMNGLLGHAREFWPEGNCADPGGCEWPGGCTNPCRIAPQAPRPGDVALFRFGRCFAHGAIVTEWPRLIHAWHAGGVMRGDATQPLLAGRQVRFFDPFVGTE